MKYAGIVFCLSGVIMSITALMSAIFAPDTQTTMTLVIIGQMFVCVGLVLSNQH